MMTMDALRKTILLNPTAFSAWDDLAKVARVDGSDETATMAKIFAQHLQSSNGNNSEDVRASASKSDSHDERRVRASEPCASTHDLSAQPADSIKQSDAFEAFPESLEGIARFFEREFNGSAKRLAIVDVNHGVITAATIGVSTAKAYLKINHQKTHVKVDERLLYRNPANGLKILSMRFSPMSLASMREVSLSEFVLELGEYSSPLSSLISTKDIYNSSLKLQLESWDGDNLRGWMAYANKKPFTVLPSLIVLIDNQPLQLISPVISRKDVAEALGEEQAILAGFAMMNMRRLLGKRGSVLEFRDPFSYTVEKRFLLSRYRAFHEQIIDISRGFCGFGVQEEKSEIVVRSLPRHIPSVPVVVTAKKKLDILVPVYKNWELTRQCLVSLRKAAAIAKQNHPWEIYVHATNDHSPERSVCENLPKLCGDLGIILHQNTKNLGFIRTVNNFMSATAGDIILVNSDVIIAKHTIQEFISARKRHGPELASLTGFSNNATIFSYPWMNEENPISSLEAINTIAEAFRAVALTSPSSTQQVPVSHGFMMYITRTAINNVGIFDEHFGLGYGEEVDWAMRASMKGFEHHICLGAYAFHKGSVSFGSSTRLRAVQKSNAIISGRYPFYDKMVEEYSLVDEFREFRNQVGMRLLLSADCPLLRVHITHASGGGISKYIDDMIASDDQVCDLIVNPGRSYQDLAQGRAATILYNFSIVCSALDAVVLGGLEEDVLPALQKLAARPMKLIIHSFVGWKTDEIMALTKFIRRNSLSYDVVAHDYMMVCPRIKLVNSSGNYCAVGQSSECGHCLRMAPLCVETSMLAPLQSDIDSYRSFFKQILDHASEIRCSTPHQAQLIKEQGFRNIVVSEPNEPQFSILPSYRHDTSSRNVVIIGGISMEKGADVLFQVASVSMHLDPSLHFYLVGGAANLATLNKMPNFTHIGPYQTFHELHEAVVRIHSPIAFFPAIWPETWCYTLSEARMLGLPIVAARIGALETRLTMHEQSMVVLFDPNVDPEKVSTILSTAFRAPRKIVDTAGLI